MDGIKCSITVQSNQTLEGQKDSNTEVYIGQYYDRLEKRYLSYKRPSEEGEVSVLINFGEASMTLTQQGAVHSKMQFVPGQVTYNDYNTPAGKLSLPVETKSYSMVQKDDFIEIKLLYHILMGQGDGIRTDMIIYAKIVD